ncbi:Type I Iterative PKS [Purpureocillium takamizusanense]|uniref:Type I Iterative PKS n=1 Tax=Purpureocillium takamizusanense TaxID=2060973 RepID=A0A9Q8QTR3_9HYPO|nr:Type I Iterative PKS [Purpureocillium takamizusanense]UNI24539.1 Type I Iterative PKS [Purpureocillium takamizusanense]
MESSEPTVCFSALWPSSKAKGEIKKVAAEVHEPFEDKLASFPQSYVGVRMDVCSWTITAPKGMAKSLMRQLTAEGVTAKEIDVQGRFHHSDNYATFRKLVGICTSVHMLQFRDSHPLVPLRRNDSGDLAMKEMPLHEMALQCILIEKAEWYTTMTRSAAAMIQGAEVSSVKGKATVLVMGSVDCIPRSIMAASPLQVLRPSGAGRMYHRYPTDSIAIIGMSCRFPNSETPQKFWDILQAKKIASVLPDTDSFDARFFGNTPREVEYMDPQHRLGLHLAYEALESGGHFSPSSSATKDIGCYVGMSSCDYDDESNCRAATAFSFTGTARAFASGRITHFFGLTGPSEAIDTAYGYRRSEGGGFVLLKRLSSAVADNDRILGVLAASAVNSSKGNRSITLPSSESQSDLYKHVLQRAGMHPCQVSYIEAHGTGTQKGDPIECQSIRQVFGQNPQLQLPRLRLGSVKGNIGHGGGASGVAAVVKVLLMLQHRLIPPQANFAVLNPAIPSLEEANMEIPQHLSPWEGSFRAALVNNYGASGTNVAMIMCQPPRTPFERTTSETAKPLLYPILISAHSTASLRRYCSALLRLLETHHGTLGNTLLPSVAFQLAQCQNHSLVHRITSSAGSSDELRALLRTTIDRDDAAPWKPRENPKPVVFVFAGQTGGRPLLSQEVYQESILLRRHLDRCDRALQTIGLHSIFPYIFEADSIFDLVTLHCMLFSLQYSVASSWIDTGLEVKALVGHSFGQLTALCVAGVLDVRDALKLISGRALLIQNKWSAEPGRMLSVDADAATVEGIIGSMLDGEKVEIACLNAPSNLVVAGTEAAIAKFEKAAHSSDINVRQLQVTHAFHSNLVDCIMHDYLQIIQDLPLKNPIIPIEPCSKSADAWANITPDLIARQSRDPVYFTEAILRIEQRLGPFLGRRPRRPIPSTRYSFTVQTQWHP